MDTGSEFAMIMTHMAKDTIKDGVELLRLLLEILSKDKELREKMLIEGFGLRELARKPLKYDGVILSKESLDKFTAMAKKEKLKHAGFPGDEGEYKVFFDKADIERVNEIFEKLKVIDFEKMEAEALNKGIEDVIRTFEHDPVDIEKEKNKDLDEFRQMRDDGKIDKGKEKVREKEFSR